MQYICFIWKQNQNGSHKSNEKWRKKEKDLIEKASNQVNNQKEDNN